MLPDPALPSPSFDPHLPPTGFGEADSIEERTKLGRQTLVEEGSNVRGGLVALVSAANDGGAEAAYLVAVLTGAGLGIKQSWPTALVYLQRAAELGHEGARRQLALLSSDAALAERARKGETAAELWRGLRQGVDIGRWLAPARARVHSISPRIGIVDGFLPHVLCDWLIEKARPDLKPAQTFDRATANLIYEAGRTNSAVYFNVPDFDFPVLLTRQRIGALTGHPTSGLEATTVLHYAVGQEFAPHWDFFEPELPGYAALIAEAGQRVLTFLIYLSEDFDGAETAFPTLNWRYRGRKGDAIFFWNVDPSGVPDKRTYHAGLAPTRGEKWLLSQWIRARVPAQGAR